MYRKSWKKSKDKRNNKHKDCSTLCVDKLNGYKRVKLNRNEYITDYALYESQIRKKNEKKKMKFEKLLETFIFTDTCAHENINK